MMDTLEEIKSRIEAAVLGAKVEIVHESRSSESTIAFGR